MAGRTLKWTMRVFVVLVVACFFAWYFLWARPFSARVFYEKAFLEFALNSPQTLSSIRLLEGIGLRGHNAHLDDLSRKAEVEFYQLLHDDLNALERYSRNDMIGQDAISYDIMHYFLTQQVEGEQFALHDYPVNQMGGVQNSFPQFMTSVHHLGDKRDAEHYISRLVESGRYFSQLLETLELQADKEIHPPRFAIDKVLNEMSGFIGVAATDNVLYTHFVEKIEAINLSDQARSELTNLVRSAIEQEVYPAYQILISHFQQLQHGTDASHGVWSLPQGDAYYRFKLAEATTTDYSPQEVHEIGLAEVYRINVEMDNMLVALGIVNGTVGERMSALGERAEFLYTNDDVGREQILNDYRDIIASIDVGMDKMFDLEIKSPVEVKRVAQFREAGSAGAFYQGPAPDGSRAGVFFVNLRNLKEHPKFAMRTLAYHEAIPGHHYQISVSIELSGVPQFRKFLDFTAFTEGWALYAEKLAFEAGFHADPYSNLGRLQAEIWRAVRLVVDTGLHSKRWTRERAIDYLIEQTGMQRSDAITEIERYMVWPGQATSYTIGMLKILELRERAKDILGEHFDLRDFHRAVLTNGPMPLFLLEQQVDQYIANSMQ